MVYTEDAMNYRGHIISQTVDFQSMTIKYFARKDDHVTLCADDLQDIKAAVDERVAMHRFGEVTRAYDR